MYEAAKKLLSLEIWSKMIKREWRERKVSGRGQAGTPEIILGSVGCKKLWVRRIALDISYSLYADEQCRYIGYTCYIENDFCCQQSSYSRFPNWYVWWNSQSSRTSGDLKTSTQILYLKGNFYVN